MGGGGLGQGSKREAAIDFAKYLISPDIASRVRTDPDFPMLAVRNNLLLSQEPPDARASLGVDYAAVGRRGLPDPDRPAGAPRNSDPRRRRLPRRPRQGTSRRTWGEPAEAALKSVAHRLDRADQAAGSQAAALALSPQPQ